MLDGCPGSRMVDLREQEAEGDASSVKVKSQLRQWPIQMHLISPMAPYFQKADVILAADCVAFAYGNFHNDYLKGKAMGIACPKLDSEQEVYVEKIKSWIEDAKINTLTILIMQVPCCSGLVSMAQEAAQSANRKVPIKYIVMSLQGEILQEDWV